MVLKPRYFGYKPMNCNKHLFRQITSH